MAGPPPSGERLEPTTATASPDGEVRRDGDVASRRTVRAAHGCLRRRWNPLETLAAGGVDIDRPDTSWRRRDRPSPGPLRSGRPRRVDAAVDPDEPVVTLRAVPLLLPAEVYRHARGLVELAVLAAVRAVVFEVEGHARRCERAGIEATGCPAGGEPRTRVAIGTDVGPRTSRQVRYDRRFRRPGNDRDISPGPRGPSTHSGEPGNERRRARRGLRGRRGGRPGAARPPDAAPARGVSEPVADSVTERERRDPAADPERTDAVEPVEGERDGDERPRPDEGDEVRAEGDRGKGVVAHARTATGSGRKRPASGRRHRDVSPAPPPVWSGISRRRSSVRA